MPKAKVFVTRRIPESGLKLLKKNFNVKVHPHDHVISKKELIAGVKWCDALLCLLTDTIDDKLLAQNPNLKIVSNYAVGYNNIDVTAATLRGIPVTNTPGVLTDAVAEHAIALMFSISRRVPESDKFTRKGKYKGWEPMLMLGSQIKGKTLGVVGLGRIGQAVAHRAFALGMNIVYSNPSKHRKFEKKFGAKRMSLNSLLKKSDFVTLHVPLIPATKHLIGRKELGLMKNTAYLINTSRGPVVNEKALTVALRLKRIAGAALDVFENEPKLTSGLSRLDNVVLTPHTASATFETRSEMSQLAAQNVIAVLKGKRAPNTVNPEVYNAKKK